MSFRINISRISRYVITNFFWIMVCGYIIALVFGSFSVVILSSVLLIVGMLRNINVKSKFTICHLYFCYILLSALYCAASINNLGLALQSIAYTLLPMIMLFVPKNNNKLFFKRSMEAILFSLVVAVLLYLFPTQKYADYLYGRSLIGKNDVRWVKASLLQGLYGITTLSNLATCSAIYYYISLITARKTKKRIIVIFVFCIVVILFAGRRSAIAALAIGILLVDIWMWFHSKISTRFLVINIAIVIGILVSFYFFYESLLFIIRRVLDVHSAMEERNSGWGTTLSSMGIYSIFGKGLGTSGHLATAAGGTGGIHDGQYILLIVETGIVGIILFTYLIIQSLVKFIRAKTGNIFPFVVVIIFLIQSIGSNVLEMPLLASFFWYSLGTIRMGKDQLASIADRVDQQNITTRKNKFLLVE